MLRYKSESRTEVNRGNQATDFEDNREMPDDASVEDAIDRLYLLYKIEKGLRQADRSELISQEEARQLQVCFLIAPSENITNSSPFKKPLSLRPLHLCPHGQPRPPIKKGQLFYLLNSRNSR